MVPKTLSPHWQFEMDEFEELTVLGMKKFTNLIARYKHNCPHFIVLGKGNLFEVHVQMELYLRKNLNLELDLAKIQSTLDIRAFSIEETLDLEDNLPLTKIFT